MKLLLVGFEAGEAESLTARLRAEGHQTVASGGAAAVELVRSFAPDRVLVPTGRRGDDVRAWFGLRAAELHFEAVGAPAPAPVTQPSPAPPPPSPRNRTNDLRLKLEQVRFADYFTVLELSPGASDYEVRRQGERLLLLYSPEGWPGPLGAEELAQLVEIRRGLLDALEMLGPKHRARYERALRP